ncbi:MAG: 4-oxalomesaconate tautomerase [Gammaproteobacteria bacterium]|jgi:4-oxalomesaconate tautomerase
MTDQRAIPFMHMRGGTSKGPVFNKKDLPEDRETLAQVLIAATGSGHIINIDGIGAGNSVTTKVPILSKSNDDWADVDYFFVQVQALEHVVDFDTTCGNMLTTVAPAALEMGLVEPQGDTTEVKILAVNTGGRFVSTVQTPGGKVVYEGDASIDGVPGTAAPIQLRFMDITGSATGKFMPTGKAIDVIEGFEVTCMDVTMPVVMGRAKDFGVTGYETMAELDENKALFAKMELVRLQAGERMGLGDVSKSVRPKFALFAPAKNGGTICTRYFMPWQTHPTLAATSSQCLAGCVMAPGTVSDGMCDKPNGNPVKITIEHPLGAMDVTIDFESNGVNSIVHSAEILRTARKLTSGEIYVPSHIWTS